MANKLELTWVGKENRPRLEPRILIEEPDKSYHAKERVSEKDIFDNRLIFGDNLLALKALEQEFSGKVRCVYIDPPFNTQQAFEHYDDAIEHSQWLTMMRDRLDMLYKLLSPTGSIWVHLDDSEVHRARCLLDEIFGAANFVGTVIWEKSDSPRMDVEFFSSRHDYILVYAKDIEAVLFNRLPTEGLPAHYDKKDQQGRPYYLKPLRAMGGQGDSRAARPNLYYALIAPDGTEVLPRRQDGSDGAWRWSKEKCIEESGRIDWVQGRNGWAPYFRIYGDEEKGRPAETIWTHPEVGSNRTSKAETKAVLPEVTPFSTPKPERLLQRVLTIATNPGDWVLDSFGGSGTTGATAHKMGRRWIMVELGEHCLTHIHPRMAKVVEGETGGISEALEWAGGGGFRYFRLAPSLIQQDEFGNPIINKAYNPEMLAEAMCKLEGFGFEPSADRSLYWMNGRSSESDFIYITTQTLSRERLSQLSEEVGHDRTLLICCGAFLAKDIADFPNLTVKKIPKAVLAKCEWGHDDYSLEIAALPKAAPTVQVVEASTNGKSNGKKTGKGAKHQRRTVANLLDFGGKE